MLRQPVVLVGVGEIGGVFARGLLRIGCPIYPVTRHVSLSEAVDVVPKPALVLVAVAESDLHAVLSNLPTLWRDRVGLLQNELLPRDWQAHVLEQPTVIVVWFEKKKGQDYRVIIPSSVYGPRSHLIARALKALDIPCQPLKAANELLFELVRKNVYILTSNIAGLVTGGTVGELWTRHEELARQVADEVLTIQEWLVRIKLPRERLIAGMVEAFSADPEHRCTGRSAPARLGRTLRHADEAGLPVAKLREIAAGR